MRLLIVILSLMLTGPVQAALTVKYADFDLATGSNDGTSEANAWQSWSAMQGGVAAGDCVNVQRTASRYDPGGNQSFNVNGSSTQPILYVGYKTTPGDCGATSWGDGGDDGINNYFQFGPRLITGTSNNIWVVWWDFTGSVSFGQAVIVVASSNTHARFLHCKFENTNTGGSSGGVQINDYTYLLGSQVKINTNASALATGVGATGIGSFAMANRVDLSAVAGTGEHRGIRVVGANSNHTGAAYGNVFLGPDVAGAEVGIYIDNGDVGHDDRIYISNNSIADFDTAIVIEGAPGDGSVLLTGNVVQNCDYGLENTGTAGYRGITEWSNFFDTNTADFSGVGDLPIHHFVNLSTDAFTSASTFDFTLNNTAGGGADCRDAREPTDFDLDGTDDNEDEPGANSHVD